MPVRTIPPNTGARVGVGARDGAVGLYGASALPPRREGVLASGSGRYCCGRHEGLGVLLLGKPPLVTFSRKRRLYLWLGIGLLLGNND